MLLISLGVKPGLTQVRITDALGVGQPYVSELERGESSVDVLLYARWCQACGVKPGATLDELLSTVRLEDSSQQ